ncbi:MAG: hypothetical protein E7234_02035 [Lachnospiraceae bacterium]|nr:hypothetical protein [Lachnospiraceae bacterium]
MRNIKKIRSYVVTLANTIVKKASSQSDAFKRAWQIVKGKLFLTKVSGVTFGNRQYVLSRLSKYHPAEVEAVLRPDQDNIHDRTAIAVDVSVNGSAYANIGYLPKDIAEAVYKLILKGNTLKAFFKGITGGYTGKETYGAVLSIQL